LSKLSAYPYAIGAVILWSTVASAFKLSLQTISVAELLLVANITSVIVLFVIVIFTGRLGILLSVSKKVLFESALFGLLNPFLYYLVLFKAYDLLPAQQAQAINYTWAITLPLLAVPFLKQPLSKNDILGLIVAYLGVVIITMQGDWTLIKQTDLSGVAYALLSTFLWALYWVLNTKRKIDPVCGLLLNFSFGLLFIALYYYLTQPLVPLDNNGVFGAIYVGIFEMSLTFYLWLKALQLTDRTANISTLIFLSPFLSLVFIHYLLGEEIKITTFLGLVVIIGGVFIQRYPSRRRKIL